MHIILACERFWTRSDRAGEVAFSLTVELSRYGHEVSVVAAEGDMEALSAAGLSGCTSLTIPYQRPDRRSLVAARDRLQASRNPLPKIQRLLLAELGATTDPYHPDAPVSADMVIGIGIESPHVRGVLARYSSASTTIALVGPDDSWLLDLGVVRQLLRPHKVAAMSLLQVGDISNVLGRPVEVIDAANVQGLVAKYQ